MKSNNQRRNEIKLKRLARAEKLKKELENTVPPYALGNPKIDEKAGVVLADAKELRIDHSKLIDGFGNLEKHNRYISFETSCGICREKLIATPEMQKYLLEVKRVPVKTLHRGSVPFCEKCKDIRSRINQLNKNGGYRKESEEHKELEALKACEEKRRKRHSHSEIANWPYFI